MKALRDEPERYPFMEQDALNATLGGNFAPLSPRFNFMGDFFLLDLERRTRADRAAFRQRAEALGAWLMAGRSAVRGGLSRLVRCIALARLGAVARHGAMAANDGRRSRL